VVLRRVELWFVFIPIPFLSWSSTVCKVDEEYEEEERIGVWKTIRREHEFGGGDGGTGIMAP
jgi:hypothetical protein